MRWPEKSFEYEARVLEATIYCPRNFFAFRDAMVCPNQLVELMPEEGMKILANVSAL